MRNFATFLGTLAEVLVLAGGVGKGCRLKLSPSCLLQHDIGHVGLVFVLSAVQSGQVPVRAHPVTIHLHVPVTAGWLHTAVPTELCSNR